MIRGTTLVAMLAVFAAASAPAQDARKKLELSGTGGWTYSDGVGGSGITVPKVGTFDRIDPENAYSWGVRVGFLLSHNAEFGVLFNQQSTELDISGTAIIALGSLRLRNYHGYFAYNLRGADAVVRPYILFGFGAAQYAPSNVSGGGVTRDIPGNKKFSGTTALGLKLFPNNGTFGIRLEGRWTPTRIKSNAAGWWCDPYWGCYVISDAQYSNQVELSGGITVRF